MIHGKTKIELYNPNTKIKNIIKSENTFQSGVLAKQLNPYGELGLPNKYNYSDLVGGILLFRDAITIGKEYMPAGNKMIGHGYRNSVTQGDYSYLGTFNASESSASASAITQVYDYATNQANGTIGCVCLTSLKGGQIGYGFEGDKYASLNFADYVGGNIGESGSQGAIYNGFKYYVSGMSDGIMTITKTPVDVQKGNIFRGLSKNLTFDVSEIGTPKTVKPYWNVMGDCGNGVFRFWSESEGISGVNVASGGTIYYYEFDATTETLSQKTLTNNSNDTLVLNNYGVQFRDNLCFIASYNGNSTGNVYIFDVDDGELIKKLTNVSNFSVYDGTQAPSFLPCELSDNLFLMQGGSGSSQYTFLYDAVLNETFNMNLVAQPKASPNFGALTRMSSVDDGVLKSIVRQTNSAYHGYAGRNPLYLATINNLQSPVTKTAAQTMKITYTLTEE